MPTNRRTRDVDRESGKNRTRKPSSRKPPPTYAVDTPTEDEPDHSDSSVEEFLEIRQKDDSRRKKPTTKPKNRRDANVRTVDHGEEANLSEAEAEKEKPSTTGGAHAVFAQALAFRSGFTTITFETRSEYIPDVSSMFEVLRCMESIVTENSLLHERFPAFQSVALTAFYAHAVYFQILRVRGDAGVLKREERRCLRTYEAIAPLESWNIAPPMIPFIQALGSIIPEGGKYGRIVPALPNYEALHATPPVTLGRLSHVRSIGRLPIVPAFHQFLRNIGSGVARFDDDDGILYPTTDKTLAATPADFLGLTGSTAASNDFQVLVFSAAWFEPIEDQADTYIKIIDQKRSIIKRWKIPNLGATRDITGLETFLGLDDATPHDWIKNLLTCSAEVNRFFPGSVNMASIPTTTRLETVSHIEVDTATARTGADDVWYVENKDWKLSLKGKLVRPDSQAQYQMALTTRMRPSFTNNIAPAAVRPSLQDMDFLAAGALSDYFAPTTEPRDEMECLNQPSPTGQALLYIQNKMYDNLGGQK